MSIMSKAPLILATSVLITACGGGGGSSSAAAPAPVANNPAPAVPTPPPVTAPPAPVSNAIAPSGQLLTLTSLDLKVGDMIANTRSDATLLSSVSEKIGALLAYAVHPLLSSAHAVDATTFKSTITAQAFPASRKMIEGKLHSLNPVVKYFENDANGKPVEKTIQCNFSNAEVSVKSAYVINQATNDLLINVELPDRVQHDCSLSYRTAIMLVYANGATFEVTSAFPNGIANIIPANDPGFNQSTTPLFVDKGAVRAAELQADGTLKMIELTASGAPLATNGPQGYFPGSLAYNGKYLLGTTSQATASTATYLMYEKDTTAFRIVKPAGSEWSTNFYLSTILDENGTYLIHYASNRFVGMNTADLSLTRFGPGSAPVVGETPVETFPSGMYGAVGRSGKWIMSDRGVIWNYGTNESKCLVLYKNGTYPDCNPVSSGTAYARIFGNYGYTVNNDQAHYVRHDFDTGKTISINLTDLGYLPKSFTVFKDTAMVEVINSANSDRKFVEINFNTGLVSDRGVIAQGKRQVDSFVQISNGRS